MPTIVFDNILRYHVDSSSRPQVKHLVDLDLYDGNGACSCENFTFNLEPKLKKGLRDPRLRCKHIKEARDRLADDVIRQASKRVNGGKAITHAQHEDEQVSKAAAIGGAGAPGGSSARPPPFLATRPERVFTTKAPRKIPPPRKKAGTARARRA